MLSQGRNGRISNDCVRDVVSTHDQRGWNYVWLAPMLGLLQWVEFREPAKTGQWRHYNVYWWSRHGAAVSHDPDKLVDEHVKFFVAHDRPIDLRFYFQTPAGFVYSAEPTRLWYELEAAFFRRHGLCSHDRPSSDQIVKYMAQNRGLAPHWGPEVLQKPVLSPPSFWRKKRKVKLYSKNGKYERPSSGGYVLDRRRENKSATSQAVGRALGAI